MKRRKTIPAKRHGDYKAFKRGKKNLPNLWRK